MSYSDDDIQFLGGTDFKPSQKEDKQKSTSQRWWAGLIALAFIALSAATIYYWQKANSRTVSFDYPLSRTSTEILRDLEKMPTDSLQGVTMKIDSLYGVSMRLYELHGLTPTLSRTAPSDSDSTVCLVTHGWDFYWDENHQYKYIGDFIYQGKEYASNHNKAGFVAIVGDKWQIGIGQDDSIKEYVKTHDGSMFRQFALVSAGQICEKQFALKGKVTRCALARKAGSAAIWYIETINKESLYDFAQALADYGFTDAIYLTGGNNGNTFYRTPSDSICGVADWKAYTNNLLIFKKVKYQ